jgi:NADH-quinone oxidoreductase subunit L
VAPALALANAAAAFDAHVIDGAVMGVGRLIGGGSQVLRRIQSGLVRRYVMTMLGGIVLVVAIFLFRIR